MASHSFLELHAISVIKPLKGRCQTKTLTQVCLRRYYSKENQFIGAPQVKIRWQGHSSYVLHDGHMREAPSLQQMQIKLDCSRSWR